jgi:hypothetical protein
MNNPDYLLYGIIAGGNIGALIGISQYGQYFFGMCLPRFHVHDEIDTTNRSIITAISGTLLGVTIGVKIAQLLSNNSSDCFHMNDIV